MKLAIFFVAFLAVSGINSLPISDNSFEHHVEDFLKLVDMKAVENLVYAYTADDDFAEAFDYFYSEEFKNELMELESSMEFHEFLDYLEKSGVPAYEYVNKLNAELKLDPITPLFHLMSSRITGGLPGFLEDLAALIPTEDFKQLYKEKMASSPEFAEFMSQMYSEDFAHYTEKVMANPHVQSVMGKAKGKGVDFDAILDYIKSIFEPQLLQSVVFESKTVRQHLHDILDLVPFDKLKMLFLEYTNDEDFGEAYDYVMGPEFQKLAGDFEKTSEFKNLVAYLEEIGVPAIEYINMFNQLLSLPPYEPSMKTLSNRITGGLPGFLQDAEKLLPKDEIKELFNKKVAEYPEFKEFVDNLKSEKFYGYVDEILKNSSVQELLEKAQAKGIDFQKILEFISSMFGFEFPHN